MTEWLFKVIQCQTEIPDSLPNVNMYVLASCERSWPPVHIALSCYMQLTVFHFIFTI